MVDVVFDLFGRKANGRGSFGVNSGDDGEADDDDVADASDLVNLCHCLAVSARALYLLPYSADNDEGATTTYRVLGSTDALRR